MVFTGIVISGSSPAHERPSAHREGTDDSVACNDGCRVDLACTPARPTPIQLPAATVILNSAATLATAATRVVSSKGFARCAAKPAARLRSTSSW